MIAENKKHFSRLGLAYLIGAVLIWGLQKITGTVLEWLKPEWLEDPNLVMIFSMLPMYLIGIPILVFLVKKLPTMPIIKRSMKVWQYILTIIMCFFVMYGSNIIGVIITGIIGLVKGSPVDNVMFELTNGTHLLVTFVCTVICAPLMEEYVFRKLIVDRTVRYGQGVAIVLSGLMFGLYHGNLNQFVYAFTIGMFFAFIYVKTGQIKYTIGLHAIINFFGGVLIMKLMKNVDYVGYLEAFEAGASEAELMNMIMDNIVGWAIILGFLILIGCLMVAGLVLFIVFRKRFVLEKGEIEIPKGQRFATVILNMGMILFILYWIVRIIYQLLG